MAPSSFADWVLLGQLLLLIVNAGLVYWYVKVTRRIRETSQDQLEAQIRPALVVKALSHDSAEIINIGSGPALSPQIAWRQSRDDVDWNAPADKNMQYISGGSGFIKAGEPRNLYVSFAAQSIRDQNRGKCWQITYRSLSDRRYATMLDFTESGTIIETPRFIVRDPLLKK